MEIFYLLSIFLLFGAFLKPKQQVGYLIISFVILLILAGFRDVSVGTDTLGYQELFNRLDQGISIRQEIGWQYLNKAVIYFGGDFEHLLIVSSLFVLFPVFYVSRKYSENPMLSIFLYFAFYIYLQSFNITRQTIAVSIVLIGYTFLIKEQYWRYCLLVIIAFFFHTTALLCLPLVFINRIPNKTVVYIGLIAVSLLIGVLFSNFLIQNSARIFGYEGYLGRFDSAVGVGIFLLVVNAFGVFVVFTSKKRDTLFKLFVLYIAFANLSSMVPFGYRVVFYFTIIQILFLPSFINNSVIKPRQLAFFLVIFYAYVVLSRSMGAGEVVPYINRLF